MTRFLTILWVLPFYKLNRGFFLFFFLLFFGVVQPGSLASYHLHLILGILSSPVALILVFIFWLLYYWKCVSYCLVQIESGEGQFLYTIQMLKAKLLIPLLAVVVLLYLPVLLYSLVVCWIAVSEGAYLTTAFILLLQVSFICLGAYGLYRRLHGWLNKPVLPHWSLFKNKRKPFFSYVLLHLLHERKGALLSVKAFCLLLLYLAMIWNKDAFDNSSFLLFFQVIIMAHLPLTLFAVAFAEQKLSFVRNMPLPIWHSIALYFFAYAVVLLPELTYSLLFGWDAVVLLLYYAVAVCTLFLLTAINYSIQLDKKEFMKAGFAIFFVSTFALHAQAFVAWILILIVIALILFVSDYYKFENEIR